MSSLQTLFTLTLLATARLAAGHGAIIAATGNAGGNGMALGVDTSTPRDGTRRNPFQQDATRFRGDAAATFGETLGGGDNALEAGTTAIMAETGDQLPQVTPGGNVQMTLHQVNADGGGPYTCRISADGTGQKWTPIPVTTTPPGRNSRNRVSPPPSSSPTRERLTDRHTTGRRINRLPARGVHPRRPELHRHRRRPGQRVPGAVRERGARGSVRRRRPRADGGRGDAGAGEARAGAQGARGAVDGGAHAQEAEQLC